MVFIFDGRSYFSQKIDKLKEKIGKFKTKPSPHLASILVFPDKASLFYTNLKKRVLESLGGNLSVYEFGKDAKIEELAAFIDKLNKNKDVHGIMIQLPLPSCFSAGDRDFLVNKIDPAKDVDGMGSNSFFENPAALAVLEVVNYSANIVRLPLKEAPYKVVVIGSRGFEGGKIVDLLRREGFRVFGVDRGSVVKRRLIKTADVVVSATGTPSVLGVKDIKSGAVVIDLGYPKPDVKRDVVDKAAFISPVPGGVGPLTVYFLMENLFGALEKNTS